jgi:hypothetical protein
MSNPLTRNTILAVAPEVTEGTYVAPTASQAIQVVELPTFTPEIEVIERNLIKGSIGRLPSLKGMEGGSLEFSIEARAAGATAGVADQPEAHDILRSAFGTFTQGTNSTTVGGSTDTLIEIDTGEGANWEAGDILLIDGEVRFVRSVSGDQLTLNRALDKGAPAGSEDVKAGWTYKPATENHVPLSFTGYMGDWEQRMIGARCASFGFSDFSTGQIPKLNFTFEILSHASVAGTLLANPVYEDQVPPVALSGNVFKDTTEFCINNLGLDMAQTIAYQTCLTSASGKDKAFVTDRVVTGTFDPLLDDTNVQPYTDWVANTDFEVEAVLSIPDSSGDFVLGTCVGVWMPQLNYTGLGFNDQDGVIANELPFSAHEGSTGNDEIYLGFI